LYSFSFLPHLLFLYLINPLTHIRIMYLFIYFLFPFRFCFVAIFLLTFSFPLSHSLPSSTIEAVRVFSPTPTPLWRCGPTRAVASSCLRCLDHTQRRTTVGMTPLDGWSARRRDLYVTPRNTHNRQTSMPPVGFEPMISAGERPQTYALERAATETGKRLRLPFFKWNNRHLTKGLTQTRYVQIWP
jgi:hypothetical protein